MKTEQGAVMEDINQYWDVLRGSNTSDWLPAGLHSSDHNCLNSVIQPGLTLLTDHPFRLCTSNLTARMLCDTLSKALLKSNGFLLIHQGGCLIEAIGLVRHNLLFVILCWMCPETFFDLSVPGNCFQVDLLYNLPS